MYDRSPLPALNLSAIGAGGDADGLGAGGPDAREVRGRPDSRGAGNRHCVDWMPATVKRDGSEEAPRRFVSQLEGHFPPYYSLHVGDFRVVMRIYDDRLVIVVVDLGPRKTIYRKY